MKFLKANIIVVFVWSHVDMMRIDLEIMCHHLNIDLIKKRVRKKRQPLIKDILKAFREES